MLLVAITYPAAMPPDLIAPVSPSESLGRPLENDWQKAGVRILVMQAVGIRVRIIFGDCCVVALILYCMLCCSSVVCCLFDFGSMKKTCTSRSRV